MPKITEVSRWRNEIEMAERFRKEQFGCRASGEVTLAGENIDYYENGFYDVLGNKDWVTTLNIVDAITSIIVPSLYFKNPRSVVLPKKIESEDTAPIVAKTIDHYKSQLETEETNQRIIWDAYVLGYGVSKTGYATRFGMDVKDEDFEKNKKKSLLNRTLEAVGLKKPKEEDEPERKELDCRIISESPFIEYVNPFEFLIDPRASSINDAMWVAQSIRKTVASMKANKKYKNTSTLRGIPSEDVTINRMTMDETAIEEFETVNLWEIHYRNDGCWYLLVISKDGNAEWREHYHEESIYEMNEWQFDMLTFKKHGHSLYPKSDITKIKNLQDRITSTIDSILEQVDKYVPKLAYSQGDITVNGKNALEFGGIGALVECSKDPNGVFKELNFTQLKADLQALIDQLISLITIQTGLTRAQLTGISQSGTATEASIEQGGQTLRLSDMSGNVQRFINKQSNKLWKVIKQFVSLDELELINGVKGVDQVTGMPKYDWLTVDLNTSEKMQNGEYDFNIEVGSTQKVDLNVMRKAFENLFNILARSEVISIIQTQGKKIDLGEILRKYFDLFPEMGIDGGKIIQNITPETPGLLPPMVNEGGTNTSSNFNSLEAQAAKPASTNTQQINEVF